MYTVRLFQNEEWEDLKSIRLEALKNCPDVLGQPYEQAAAMTKEQWQARINDPSKGLFGVYDGKKVIGFLFIYIFAENPHEANINSLYINRAYHRKGIDALLFEKSFTWAKEMKCTSVTASCKETNYASKRLIEKYGGILRGQADELFHYPDGSSTYLLNYSIELV